MVGEVACGRLKVCTICTCCIGRGIFVGMGRGILAGMMGPVIGRTG